MTSDSTSASVLLRIQSLLWVSLAKLFAVAFGVKVLEIAAFGITQLSNNPVSDALIFLNI